MIQKTIGLYSDTHTHSPFNRDTLVVEVGKHHVVCVVKSEKDAKVTAFEFFKIEADNNDWEDIFYELRTNSGLIDKSYNDTHIFYQFDESVLIPAFKFSNNDMDAYLDLVFGNADKTVVKADSLNLNNESIYNAYRLNESLYNTIHRNFLSITEHHVYSGILKALYNLNNGVSNYIHLNFYYNHFIICAVKNSKLQIVQSIPFATANDVLYHVVNIANQFNFSSSQDLLSIAGIVDVNELVFRNLKQHFGNVFLTAANAESFEVEKLATYPLHYFTPFFNLHA